MPFEGTIRNGRFMREEHLDLKMYSIFKKEF